MSENGERLRRFIVSGLGGLFFFASTGCFAVANLDRFHAAEDQGGDSGPADGGGSGGTGQGTGGDTGMPPRDYQLFQMTLIGFKPHETQFFEYRIIDSNNFIQSRGFVDALKGDETTLIAPRGIPPLNGPYRLDFYVDMNKTQSYDGIGDTATQDHAWRIDPLADYPDNSVHVDGAVTVQFTHNLLFTDIDKVANAPRPAGDTGVDAFLSFTNMDDHIGKMLEVRIAESTTGHVVGLYRMTAVPSVEFMFTLPGIIDPGVDYAVDLYVDANVNGVYDNPASNGGDIGWRLLKQSSDTTGLHINFDPTMETNSSVDVGPP